MKPITADYELCKELYDLGVRIDSYFVDVNEHLDKRVHLCHRTSLPNVFIKADRVSKPRLVFKKPQILPRPQLHEVLDVMLSSIVCHGRTHYYLNLLKITDVYFCKYIETTNYRDLLAGSGTTEDPNSANAVIKTAIWLIKNNYVEVKDGNIT